MQSFVFILINNIVQNMSIQAFKKLKTSAAGLLKRGVVGAAMAMLLMCLASVAMASQVVGEVTLTIGKSKIERSTQEAEPQKGGSVQEGDVIRTSDNGHVHIRFIDGARVSVRPNSVFRIHEFKYSPADPAASVVRLSLDSGEARSISGAAAQAAAPALVGPPPTALDTWIRIAADGSVVANFGKMDCGQGKIGRAHV